MKKTIVLIINILFAMCLLGEEITIEKAVDIYMGNCTNGKYRVIDTDIQKIKKTEIEQKAYKNMALTLKSDFETRDNKINASSKLTYNEFYLNFAPRTDSLDNSKAYVSFGVEKKLNDFIFDTDKYAIYLNKLDTQITEIQYRASLISEIDQVLQKYITIKEIDQNIKLYKIILLNKEKEYEIAKIKSENNLIGKSEVENALSNMNIIKMNIDNLIIDYEEGMEDFKRILGIEGNVVISDNIEDIETYNIYYDDTSVKLAELQLMKEEENYKSVTMSNLPQGNLSAGYDIDSKNFSAGLSITFYPLNYEGNEKETVKKIEKLKIKLEDEKKKYELLQITKKNEIQKLERTKKISYEETESLKKEMGKYEVLYNNGAASEYDYFTKQMDYVNKLMEYNKYSNSLIALKMKNDILYRYFKN